jgi:hypothetical protein
MDDYNAIAARLAEISSMIKQLEEEKQNLLVDISFGWSLGDLDNLINDKGHAIFDDIRVERRQRETWTYSPAIKAAQEQERHTGKATSKVTTYYCVAPIKTK